jgi:hypothetical protein
MRFWKFQEPQYELRINLQPLNRVRYSQYEQVILPCYRMYVYSLYLSHGPDFDIILNLYHGGIDFIFLYSVLRPRHQYAWWFLSSFSLIFILSLFYKFLVFPIASLRLLLLFTCFYLPCFVTSLPYVIETIYLRIIFSNILPCVLILAQRQHPAL